MHRSEESRQPSDQVLVRVSPELFAALQLALPFENRRSMQDLAANVLEDFVEQLAARDSGFRAAMTGLAESRAQRAGVLARRLAARQHPNG